ncbi:uncharacterized protein LOC100168587 [Acyrthosiphon pisum]|uniref:ACYPI009273 protein n=1 Tax=Acyrthosiphon pisum TaxID=7029 RepID=C4WY76_ACYPI|nr:uncharacterized protein LOC100168587 [Acyrthosiphon pisum]BAH72846.1 ACYPI009273 [Acyrthosiphon pisum]|eukprot:NP_001155794.1 uncharacterized protein LOC100168587 [Acyrthosiphon pisum]
MSCCVPNCPFRDKYLKQISFCVPQDPDARSTWERVLRINFDNNSRVCRRHFSDSDIIETWVPGVGDDNYAMCLNKPMLRDEAIPVRVREMDSYNDGSIILNDKTNISENIGTGCGDVHDLLSSINSDHCYTTIQIQEHKVAEVNHNFGAGTMNGLKRDADLFNVELTSSISKRIKPSQTW